MIIKVGVRVVRQDGLEGTVAFVGKPSPGPQPPTCVIRDEHGLRHGWVTLDGSSLTSDHRWTLSLKKNSMPNNSEWTFSTD